MKKQIISVALLTFVNVLGFTILIPVLPFIVENLGGTPITFGILLSIYSIFQLIGSPLLGSLSDHYGRRPILLISQLGTLLSWGIFALYLLLPNTPIPILNTTLPILIIALSRMVDGITGGNMAVANAYLSDITTKDERAHMFGIMGGMAGLGFIIGPAIGGLSAKYWGPLGTLATAGVISLITLIMMYMSLEESLPEDKRTEKTTLDFADHLNVWKKLKPYLNNRIIREVLQIHLFFAFVLSGYTSITTLFLIDSFGFDEGQIAKFLSVVGLFIIFNQIILLKPLVKKIGELKVLLLGQFLLGIGLVLITQSTSILILLAFYYVLNMGTSLSYPTVKSLLTQNVSEKEQGKIMGLDESIAAFCSAIAPASAATLYYTLGNQAFWALSMCIVISLFLFWVTSWIKLQKA